MTLADPWAVRLTPRQRAVLIELLRGESPERICENLGMSIHTTRVHIRAIHRLYRVHSRSQLMALFLTEAVDRLRAQETPVPYARSNRA